MQLDECGDFIKISKQSVKGVDNFLFLNTYYKTHRETNWEKNLNQKQTSTSWCVTSPDVEES